MAGEETTPRPAYAAYLDRAPDAEGRRRQQVVDLPLREPLGAIPVPLRHGESDVRLDLQAALDATYSAARYDLEIDYARPPEPPLSADDAAWAREVIRSGAASPAGPGA